MVASDDRSALMLAAVFAGAGAMHFALPAPYERLIPPFLGSPRPWIYGSGVLELLCAAGLANRATRREAGLAAAALLVAVFPGNIWMTVDPGRVPRWLALARLPLQAPLIAWALRVRATAPA